MNDEIRKKIQKIKIHTKRMMSETLVGDYVSAFKGSGLDFDQIRDYSPGDDVRFIDWNNSAKTNEIMIKQFVQERDRTVILVIDVSASLEYGSHKELKKDMAAQVAASLAFIAEQQKDRVGALFFSDKVEAWIPPSRSKSHVSRILDALFSLKPSGKKTTLDAALKFLINLNKRNAIVFCISDWIADINAYTYLLKRVSIMYDFIGVRIIDAIEKQMPAVGLLPLYDIETGHMLVVDTSKKELQAHLTARLLEQKKLFDRYRIDLLDLSLEHSFVKPMISFFHNRIIRQV